MEDLSKPNRQMQATYLNRYTLKVNYINHVVSKANTWQQLMYKMRCCGGTNLKLMMCAIGQTA